MTKTKDQNSDNNNKSHENTKHWQGCEATRTLTHTMESILAVDCKIKHSLPM